jgi:hypothetical protein
MVGLTTSQSRGLEAQSKQLGLRGINQNDRVVNFRNKVSSKSPPLPQQHQYPARKYLESLHGVKYYRKDNNRGDIRYIPKNLKNTLK